MGSLDFEILSLFGLSCLLCRCSVNSNDCKSICKKRLGNIEINSGDDQIIHVEMYGQSETLQGVVISFNKRPYQWLQFLRRKFYRVRESKVVLPEPDGPIIKEVN